MKGKMLWASLCVALSLVACEKPSPEPAPPAQAQKVEPVKLSAQGQKFEPPVAVEAIPEGGWYCDMGTVHYARSEEGDGKCPLCHMTLKEKKHEH